MTPDKRVGEILNNNRNETLYDSDEANETAANAIDNFIKVVLPELTQTLTQLVKEVEAGERERIREIINSKNYTVHNDPSEYAELFDVLSDAINEALTPPTRDVTEK